MCQNSYVWLSLLARALYPTSSVMYA